MPFIPHTAKETEAMLKVIGAKSVDELFDEIPAAIRVNGFDKVPTGISEMQATRILQQRASLDHVLLNFLGAGAYEHHIPAVVWDITSRGEFLTAYTPYQAEASQGTLQLLYEFQTMIANLMAMEVSNTSLYDGASALAESILMAVRSHKKSKSKTILVAGSLNPTYKKVAETIVSNQGIQLISVPFDLVTGTIDVASLAQYNEQDIAAIVISQPNFLGNIEDVHVLTDWAHQHDSLVIGVVNPLAMALLTPPGEWGTSEQQGADIVCGELQPMGMPLASGGPYAGFMCCKQVFVRQMPGRIIGCTNDVDGKRGFTLTLQAREQHIRRGKATSNICTNQGLLVTAASIHMSLLGPEGTQRVAQHCHANTKKMCQLLLAIDGISEVFNAPFFHERVLRFEKPVAGILKKLSAQGIQAGYDLSKDFPSLENCLLICVTETKTDEDLEQFAKAIQQCMEQVDLVEAS